MQLVIYSSALLVAILTLILSIYSLQAPAWIRFDTPKSSPFQFSSIYGLTQKCDKSNLHLEFQCRPFPQIDQDCQSSPAKDFFKLINSDYDLFNRTGVLTNMNGSRKDIFAPLGGGLVSIDNSGTRDGFGFCEKWITAAYTAQLSIIIGVVNLFSTFMILISNRYRQEHGWKICAGLISIHGIFQTIAWVLIVTVFHEDNRFYFGSRLTSSTIISIITSVIDLVFFTALIAAGLSGIFKPCIENPRNEYEQIQ